MIRCFDKPYTSGGAIAQIPFISIPELTYQYCNQINQNNL